MLSLSLEVISSIFFKIKFPAQAQAACHMNPDNITGIMWQLRNWCRARGAVGMVWETIAALQVFIMVQILVPPKSQNVIALLPTGLHSVSLPVICGQTSNKAFLLVTAKMNKTCPYVWATPFQIQLTMTDIDQMSSWYHDPMEYFLPLYTCLFFYCIRN